MVDYVVLGPTIAFYHLSFFITTSVISWNGVPDT